MLVQDLPEANCCVSLGVAVLADNSALIVVTFSSPLMSSLRLRPFVLSVLLTPFRTFRFLSQLLAFGLSTADCVFCDVGTEIPLSSTL